VPDWRAALSPSSEDSLMTTMEVTATAAATAPIPTRRFR
jgi:hypothetical protein